MEDKKSPNNILQFPGRKMESTESQSSVAKKPVAKAPGKKPKASKKNLAGSVLAVVLFSAAVNGYVFKSASSMSSASRSRGLASAESQAHKRNADWEMKMAQNLSTAGSRELASLHIGRSPTAIEKMRFGTLEEKYTITYQEDAQLLRSVSLQDAVSSPAYVQDRQKFLAEYGHLMSQMFESSKLESVQTTDGKTVEAYTLFDKDNKAAAQALFELDRHSRLLSLKVEPVQI